MKGLVKRLPLLVVLGIAVWWWKSGGGGVLRTRELIWNLGPEAAILREVDIQIQEQSGALAKREQFRFAGPPASQLVQKVHLADGDYPVRVFLRRAGADRETPVSLTLHVAGDDRIVVSLPEWGP